MPEHAARPLRRAKEPLCLSTRHAAYCCSEPPAHRSTGCTPHQGPLWQKPPSRGLCQRPERPRRRAKEPPCRSARRPSVGLAAQPLHPDSPVAGQVAPPAPRSTGCTPHQERFGKSRPPAGFASGLSRPAATRRSRPQIRVTCPSAASRPRPRSAPPLSGTAPRSCASARRCES